MWTIYEFDDYDDDINIFTMYSIVNSMIFGMSRCIVVQYVHYIIKI